MESNGNGMENDTVWQLLLFSLGGRNAPPHPVDARLRGHDEGCSIRPSWSE